MWWSKKRAVIGEDQLEQLISDQTKLLRLVHELQRGLEEITDKHMRLRGLVYARKLHKPEGADEPAAPANDTAKMSRDELRRHLGLTGRFTPGKPPVHT